MARIAGVDLPEIVWHVSLVSIYRKTRLLNTV